MLTIAEEPGGQSLDPENGGVSRELSQLEHVEMVVEAMFKDEKCWFKPCVNHVHHEK